MLNQLVKWSGTPSSDIQAANNSIANNLIGIITNSMLLAVFRF
jgi:hypothetical protein